MISQECRPKMFKEVAGQNLSKKLLKSIIKNKDKVIVLDLNYEEIYSINTNELIDSNLDLTYIRNNLYYKERKKENNKLVYKYFDVKTNEEVYTTTLGGSNE